MMFITRVVKIFYGIKDRGRNPTQVTSKLNGIITVLLWVIHKMWVETSDFHLLIEYSYLCYYVDIIIYVSDYKQS